MDNIVRKYTQEVPIIAFISDLHFDFTKGEYCETKSEINKRDFLNFVKEHYCDTVLCIAGDCFNDYKRTLEFIKELEKEEVLGFFVLGNHDYWNEEWKSYDEIISIFENETRNHKHFRLLTYGRKYYIGELCFIGDTGWTSFRRNGKLVDTKMFASILPEEDLIRNFSCEDIIKRHDQWIEYANQIIQEEDKTIILTHFPMIDFSKEPKDCWWSSETRLIKNHKYWNIFGHTHRRKQKQYNFISAQRGYNNLSREENFCSQYREEDVGILVKTDETDLSTELDVSGRILKKFYEPMKLETVDYSIVKNIQRVGYKRCSANKEILSSLAMKPDQYLQKVKERMRAYEVDTFIGYQFTKELKEKTIQGIYASIRLLEQGLRMGNLGNPREFITAAIITGYVYNGYTWALGDMRPVNDYDVIRFYLVFLTMKRYGMEKGYIQTVRGHQSRYVLVGNVKIRLPIVNEQCMTLKEVSEHFEGISNLMSGEVLPRIPQKGREKKTDTERTPSYGKKKLRDLKADIYSLLNEKEGDLEEIRNRLEELRRISEKKYEALKDRYQKYDVDQILF